LGTHKYDLQNLSLERVVVEHCGGVGTRRYDAQQVSGAGGHGGAGGFRGKEPLIENDGPVDMALEEAAVDDGGGAVGY